MNENHAMALIDTLFDYLINIDDHYLPVFLEKWPSKPYKTRKVSRRLLPVLSYLPEIDVYPNEKSADAVEALKSCADNLSWGQTYTAKTFGEAFLENYGWTELIGLRGPVASEDIACGFLLLGPNTEYPKHSHEAEEVYVPYSSQAFWIQREDDWIQRPRGVPIYHKPWISHGMRTSSTPLLTLYIWHGGNLAQKSHIE